MAIPRAARSLSPPSTDEAGSEGRANFCDSSTGSADRAFALESASPPDIDVLVEKRLLMAVLPRMEPPREPGELERTLSAGGLPTSGSTVESRDMPGSCLLAETGSGSEAVSSWDFLKAAEPLPPSADCRKKAGSFAPSEAAMELREGFASGEEVGSGVCVVEARSGERDATESGRRMLPDCGLCFHERVPDRPSAAALVAGFLGSTSSSVMGWSWSPRVASCEGGLMVGMGVLMACSCTALGVPVVERGDCGVYGLSGEIDRARSVWGNCQQL